MGDLVLEEHLPGHGLEDRIVNRLVLSYRIEVELIVDLVFPIGNDGLLDTRVRSKHDFFEPISAFLQDGTGHLVHKDALCQQKL